MDGNQTSFARSVLESRKSGCASIRSAVALLIANGSTEDELQRFNFSTEATRKAVKTAINSPNREPTNANCFVHGCKFVASDSSTNVQMARHLNRMHSHNDLVPHIVKLRQEYGIAICRVCYGAHAGTVLQHQKACNRAVATNEAKLCVQCRLSNVTFPDAHGVMYCGRCWQAWNKKSTLKRSRLL